MHQNNITFKMGESFLLTFQNMVSVCHRQIHLIGIKILSMVEMEMSMYVSTSHATHPLVKNVSGLGSIPQFQSMHKLH